MSQTELLKYDFAAAANVERPLARAIRVWTDKFCEMFPERWGQLAPGEVSVRPTHVNAFAFEQAQKEWDRTLAAVVQIREGTIQGFLIGHTDDFLRVVAEILDQPMPEAADDSEDGDGATSRELTAVEASLAGLFLEQVAATLGESWPRQEPLPIQTTEIERQPKRSRMFAPEQVMLMIGLQFQLAQCGTATIHLVVPKPQAMALFEIAKDAGQPSPSGETIGLQTVSNIQVEVTAELGQATLDLGDFLTLTPGDIIVLEQKVDEPLRVQVNGIPKFHGWPGRQGHHQVIKIASTS